MTTAPSLILDAVSVIDIFGRPANGGQYDSSRGVRALEALAHEYKLYITDTVWDELVPDGADHPNNPGLNDALNDLYSREVLGRLETGISAESSNAGDLSIKTVMDNPLEYSNDLDGQRYIATRDAAYFGPNGDGAIYSNAVKGTQGLLSDSASRGHLSITDYQKISTIGSPSIGGWDDPRPIAADALSSQGVPTTWDPVNGRFNIQSDTGIISVPEDQILKPGSNYSNIGEYLGANGDDALSLTDKINAKIASATTLKALAALGIAAAAADAAFTSMRAQEKFNNGDSEGGYEELYQRNIAGRIIESNKKRPLVCKRGGAFYKCRSASMRE